MFCTRDLPPVELQRKSLTLLAGIIIIRAVIGNVIDVAETAAFPLTKLRHPLFESIPGLAILRSTSVPGSC